MTHSAWTLIAAFIILAYFAIRAGAKNRTGNRKTDSTDQQKTSWQSKVKFYGTRRSADDNTNFKEKAPNLESWQTSICGLTQHDIPKEWSKSLLQNIEWKLFEDVCQNIYALKGIRSDTTSLGPDGGIDIILFEDHSETPTTVIQCKSWMTRNVGIKPVRELLGVMHDAKVSKAIFMTTGHFTDDAIKFARNNGIILINGDGVLQMIDELSQNNTEALLSLATKGDYTTPTCPKCNIKMHLIQTKNANFWGCSNFPGCKQKIGLRKTLQ